MHRLIFRVMGIDDFIIAFYKIAVLAGDGLYGFLLCARFGKRF